MSVAVRASLILVALVSLLSIAIQVTGLNANFLASQFVFLVGAIALNVAIVIWALTRTATTAGYGGQVANAATIGLLGGVLIIVTSWILLSFVFPDALDQMRSGAIDFMDSQNMAPEEYQKQMEVLGAATPMSQSLPGGFGTFFTSLVTGAVFGFFKRRK